MGYGACNEGQNGGSRRRNDSREGAFHDEEDEREDGRQGYQLLTEVKNGVPMSSLFTILSLFTEDVKLRHDVDEFEGGSSTGSSIHGLGVRHEGDGEGETPITPAMDGTQLTGGHPMQGGGSGNLSRSGLPAVPPLSLNS